MALQMCVLIPVDDVFVRLHVHVEWQPPPAPCQLGNGVTGRVKQRAVVGLVEVVGLAAVAVHLAHGMLTSE